MTTPRERLAALPPLSKGAHEHVDEGACFMEAVSYVAGEPWSDTPACACPVLGAFLRTWNDHLPTDADRDRLLRPLVRRLAGSRSTPEVEARRHWLAMDWLVRTHAPTWLRLTPALVPHADALTDLPPLADAQTAAATIVAARAATGDAAGAAAGGAAWAAVRAAAGGAAWAAVRAAARDAAWVTARAPPGTLSGTPPGPLSCTLPGPLSCTLPGPLPGTLPGPRYSRRLPHCNSRHLIWSTACWRRQRANNHDRRRNDRIRCPINMPRLPREAGAGRASERGRLLRRNLVILEGIQATTEERGRWSMSSE